jgi:hypothetical protein
MAPVLSGTFQGLTNPPIGRDVIPPNAMGAAGPFHLVAMPVSDFGVFDKAGALLESVPLDEFWAGLVTPPGVPADFPFDTRVLFDQHSGRFVAVAMDCTVNPHSWLMIAVSATDNALGVWNKWAIDADIDGEATQTLNWADFPGVGIDANNLYVAANMFQGTAAPSFQYSKVWVIPKAQLLAGQNPVTWHEFPNPPGSLSTLQPAHVFGTAPAAYVVFEDWQFLSPPPPPNRLWIATIDNVTGTPVWNPPVPVPVAPYNQEFILPEAPQAVEPRGIDTADTRLWNAVYRNGFLWTTHHVDAGNKTEVSWYRIDPSAGAVSAQGRIGDPVRWHYFPSIAVRGDDVAAVGFSGSSSREYVGGYYTVIRPPYAGEEPVALLKSGEDTYFKDFGFGTNRWGDLSATVVDPSDGLTFWTIQEYAWTREFDPIHNEFRSRWALWWGKFLPSDVPAPTGLTATVVNGSQVHLTWTDQSANEAGFRIERRQLPGGDYSDIGGVGPNANSFLDNSAQSAGVLYSYRVQAFDAAGGGSYSAEAFASPPAAPPEENGGGGCLSVSPSVSGTTDIGAVASVLLLLLPAAVCRWKRRFRRGSSS